MVNKEFDIIVYGATGFTGQLICEYLNNHKDINQIILKLSDSKREDSVQNIIEQALNELNK